MSDVLAHSPAHVLSQVLIDLGQASDPDDGASWPVYVNGEPTSPDNCVTVYDTEGEYHGRVGIDGEIQEHYGFQIRVRSSRADDGYQKAGLIRRALAESVDHLYVLVESDNYLVYNAAKLRGIFSLGTDTPAGKRRLFTFNGLLALTPTLTASVSPNDALTDSSNFLVDHDGNYLVGV